MKPVVRGRLVPVGPPRKVVRYLAGVCGFVAVVFARSAAHAQTPAYAPRAALREDADTEALMARPKASGFRVESSPRVSVSLGPTAGLTLLSTGRGADAHIVAGGVAHLRVKYFELGGQLELSDRAARERWRLLGGFVGGFIPYENWVDFEFAVGAGVRHYLNSDERYGAGGYDIKTPVLTLRAGLSDRLGQNLFGVRMGAELLVGMDLRRQEATWTYSYTDLDENSVVVRGTTPVGGLSVGLGVSVELDVAPRHTKAR